ncbi:MAG: hypothetical protein KTR19_10415 [Hyphomicrobiales bacterium]|nr:hypothetical protein [Hyphomicrobiales bacterium]
MQNNSVKNPVIDEDRDLIRSKEIYLKIAWWMLVCAASIIQHKYFVFKAGLLTRASWWRLLKHDLSKFGWEEWYGYARNWHGDKGDYEAWQRAWLHHRNVNDHHWQYWVEHDNGFVIVHPMPIEAVRELVADWIGATRTHTGRVTRRRDWVRNSPVLRLSRDGDIAVKVDIRGGNYFLTI